MKVKIFNDGNLTELQNAINKWLTDHPNVSVNTFLQSESDAGGHAVTITIVYLEFEGS